MEDISPAAFVEFRRAMTVAARVGVVQHRSLHPADTIFHPQFMLQLAMDKRRHWRPPGGLQLRYSLPIVCSLIVLSAVAGGCKGNGDECSYGDVRCVGNTAQSCERQEGAGDY